MLPSCTDANNYLHADKGRLGLPLAQRLLILSLLASFLHFSCCSFHRLTPEIGTVTIVLIEEQERIFGAV
jgi:hypothetical protein